MIISPWLIGGIIGLIMSAITFLVLGKVINQQENEGRIERGQPGYMLDLVRKIDLVTFPIVGALIGHFAFGGSQ